MVYGMQPYGIQSMLKEGHKHLSGLDEAVLKNIDACKQLSTITRTSVSPNVRNEEGEKSVSTVVLRGSTDSILDDLERAVDDGVNTYKAMCRDSRIVPGAAATEIELARRLKEFSFKETRMCNVK